MTKLTLTTISRKDKRDRCGNCLRPFKKGQFKKKVGLCIERFPNRCLKCCKNAVQVNESYMEYCERRANELIESNNKELDKLYKKVIL